MGVRIVVVRAELIAIRQSVITAFDTVPFLNRPTKLLDELIEFAYALRGWKRSFSYFVPKGEIEFRANDSRLLSSTPHSISR